MRVLLFIVLSIFHLSSTASVLDKRTEAALGYISQGYIQYGFQELKRTAATNSIAAQYYVAVCYDQGIGVEKNPVDAFKMYRKAAERGLPDAMWHIATFYRDGTVVSQDSSKENEWLERFNQKGGQFILPDIVNYYNDGLKYPNHYALNPNSSSKNQNPIAIQPQPVQQPRVNSPITPTVVSQRSTNQPKGKSINKKIVDVDQNIPIGNQNQNNTYVIVIANENYQEVEKVPNAINDGTVFAEYCNKTLGIPQSNIKVVKDATYNNIRRNLSWLSQVIEVFNGKASVIFYYAGHGIPDERNGSAYLLPVDGIGSDVSTGYSLEKLYSDLSSYPTKSVIVFLDACFSGTKREGGMLASARGVAIKAKKSSPMGNMVVLSAAQGDETAYPYKEKEHGMFTYYLLKKLQESKGKVTIGELADYVIAEVKKSSIVLNGKIQTPSVSASQNAGDWRNWKINK